MSGQSNVAIVGATGKIGSSIVSALLNSQDHHFKVTALVQPASADKPTTNHLAQQNVNIVLADLQGELSELTRALNGFDVVICALPPNYTLDQIPLADAALQAGVKRFVPSMWSTVAPQKNVMKIRDTKEDVINHLTKIGLPYTVIDIGFWHEIMIPRVGSGRLDHVALYSKYFFVDKGLVPCATIHIDDVGRYVTHIISDPRTLNRMVFAYGEVTSQSEAVQLIQRVADEGIPLVKVNYQQVSKAAQSGKLDLWPQVILEYVFSAWARGDNQPAQANFLGYLDAKDLYPDLQAVSLEETVVEALKNGGVNPGFGSSEFCESIKAELLSWA
ncbi:NmrA domain-containing protein [Fusarium sp. LHS14.1]|nr:NmrA domain-containing protein [Fusarium sp. LHS14.1]